MKNKIAAVALMGAMFFSLPAQAGWRITQTDTINGRSYESVLLMDGKKMRSESQAQPIVTIIDLTADRLLLVDFNKKEYGQKRLSSFVEDFRLMFEQIKMVKAQMPPEIAASIPDPADSFKMQLVPTGKSDKVSGYTADEFNALDGFGNDAGNLWLSKDSKMGKMHNDFMAFSKAMGKELTVLAPMLAMAQEKGFPVKSHLLQGQDFVDSLVTSIKEQPVAAQLFTVPSAFKEVPFEQFVPGGMPNVTTIHQQQLQQIAPQEATHEHKH